MSFNFPFNRNNLPKQLFIGNKYVNSKSDKVLEVHSPKNDDVVADDVALAGEDDVNLAVAAAEDAFKTWKKSTASERRNCLLRLADLIEKHRSELSELTRITLGSPKATFGKIEVGIALDALRYYAGWTDKFAGESYPQDDGFLKIVRNEPLGVCAGILPWNCPLGNVGLKVAPALATGNVIIIKASEKTPFSALSLGALIVEAGFPPGVFQILSGDGSTGALLASHEKIKKVSFTGSTQTGRRILELAAKSNLKRVTLELGGKSPAVIFDDANLDNAIPWCVNAIATNSGQICFAATRVYVQEGIYPEFVARYKAALLERSKGAGDPDSEETTLGPLVDRSQFDRVQGFIERGKEQGDLIVGGKQIGTDGFYIEPTVFENVADDAEIMKEEIFGPVSVINKFKTEDEIVAKANDTYYGLMAGVFTQDINKALRFASEVDAGMVGVNAMSLAFVNAPFGGTKLSGVGRENAMDALYAYTEKKTVFINMHI